MNLTVKRIVRRTANNLSEEVLSNLTANDLKTKDIAAIKAALAERPQAIVSVRGKERFVVMETRSTSTCMNASEGRIGRNESRYCRRTV